MKSSFLRRFTGPALAGLLMTLAPLAFSSLATYYAIANESVMSKLTPSQWLLLTALCCLTSTFALTPPTLLALVFGYFLGWRALLPLFTLNMGAIFLVYTLVHWLDKDRFIRFVEQNPKARQVLERIRERELSVIFFTKLSPVMPFALTNLVFALSGARRRNIMLGGFLGMVPRTALAIWTGSQAREIRTLLENPNQGSYSQIILITLLIVSVLGLVAVLQRAFRAK